MNYDIDPVYEFSNRKVVAKSLNVGEETTKELIGNLSEDITITSFD